MDTNDQQYQNLSYTFQNLALSPPPPLAPQPPNGGEFIPQQQQQQHQQHQQRDQQQQQHPGSYGYSNGGGGFDPRGPYGDLPPGGGMTSIGRQGWGAQPGIPGGLSMGKSQRGARGGLPSQWLDPSPNQFQGHQPPPHQQQQGGHIGGASSPSRSISRLTHLHLLFSFSPYLPFPSTASPQTRTSTSSPSPPPPAPISSPSSLLSFTSSPPRKTAPPNPLSSHLSSTSVSPPLEHAMYNPYAVYGEDPSQLPHNHNNHPTPNRTSNAPRYGGFANGLAGLGASAVGNGAGSWGSPMLAGGLGAGGAGPFAMGPGVGGGMDDDVIPTAIVIKNINFNLQKEDLLRTIESLGAPLPYAFNYHMDQGVFRGLAFANFRSPLEADAVVAALNGYDVGGRKLRVEYKKVLQAGEKERIEREKALRRMRSIQAIPPEHHQLTNANQHMSQQQQQQQQLLVPAQIPGQQGQQQQQQQPGPDRERERDDSYPGIQPVSLGLGLGASRGSSGAGSDQQQQQQGQQQQQQQGVPLGQAGSIPIVQVTSQGREREGSFGGFEDRASDGSGSKPSKSAELDLNDPTALDIYSRVLVFKEDRMRDELAFSRTLTALQRRVVHLVAQKLGVYHYSVGEGDERYAVVTRSEGRNGAADRQTLRHHASRPNLPSHHPNPLLQNAQSQNQNLYASSPPSLRNKSSMPDLSHLHGPAVARDPSRAIVPQRSNGNLRDGYATVGGASGQGVRRSQTSGGPQQPGGAPPFQNALFGDSLSPGNILTGPSDSTDSLISSSTSNGGGGTSPVIANANANVSNLAASNAALLRQPRGPPGEARGFAARRFVVPAAPGSALPGRSASPLGMSPEQQQYQQQQGAPQQQQRWEGQAQEEDFATSHEPLEV
ncbi:hypothetical protein BDY24DRAFT_369991 [Mrakia frigida]|uniref:Pin4p n=1 Tax=Mrakia frigida TaxID=29902 RepID=UPI003FCC0A34